MVLSSWSLNEQWRGAWGFLPGLSLRAMEKYMGPLGLSAWSLTKGNGEVHGAYGALCPVGI